MFVKIGPYVDWIGPYQIAEKILFWLNRYEDDRVHKFGHWLAGGDGADSILMKLCDWIHSKKKRNVKIRIDKYDTWNMNSTLAIIILPMLKQLKEKKHGAPGNMPSFGQTSNSSTQFCFEFYESHDDIAWVNGQMEWDTILDKMIWSFEQLQPDCDWEKQYTIIQPELDFTKYPEYEGKTSFPVRWKVEGKIDWDGRLKHENKIQEGMELFGKYFQNLWS